MRFRSKADKRAVYYEFPSAWKITMTIAYWCILISALLPYIWAALAKLSKPGLDNREPRIFLDNLDGWGQRAHWTQLNGFETFPAFAAAVIVGSLVNNIEQIYLDSLAALFVVCRVLHGVFYVLNMATLRSTVWLISMGSWIGIFVLSGT